MDKEMEVSDSLLKPSTQVTVTTEELLGRGHGRGRGVSLSRHDTDREDWKTGVIARSQYPSQQRSAIFTY